MNGSRFLLGTIGVGFALLDIFGTMATLLATYAACRLSEVAGRSDLGGTGVIFLILVPLTIVMTWTRLPLHIKELWRNTEPVEPGPGAWALVVFFVCFGIGSWPPPTQMHFTTGMICGILAVALAYRYTQCDMGPELWTMCFVVLGTLVFVITGLFWSALIGAAVLRALGVIIYFYGWKRAGRASMPNSG